MSFNVYFNFRWIAVNRILIRLLASSFGAGDVFHAKLDKDNIFEHEF